MKLLNSTGIYSLAVYLVVFGFGGILFFYLFQIILDEDLNRKLHERKNYVVKQMSQSDSLVHYQSFSANTLTFKRIAGPLDQDELISDTTLYDDIEHKQIRYRQLVFKMASNGSVYKVHLRRALVEQKDLVKGVVVLEVLLFIGFMATLTFLNNQLSKRIWKPFYQILDRINGYRPDRIESLSFKKSRITEFNELASSIEKMSSLITTEFTLQKEFIENASHETQTPLAIIRNKLEELIQLPELTEAQMQSISKALLAANRLSKLNEALLILSRIENRQFHTVEDVCINDLITTHLNNFTELIQMKGIRVINKTGNVLCTKLSPYLADILIENIIVNAIKHNDLFGIISVSIIDRTLVVANTGGAPVAQPLILFKRFAKADTTSNSLGLGLSIVKAVCDTYDLPLRYAHENGLHKISVEFPDRAT